ncbi:TPA: hypothetical protein ACOQ31_005577 [Bacillus cereus]|nr:hypothetical protein [Bacillus cereus]MBL3768867.1 hypothetical protein [Bacillus cereus]MBL3774701.1 hypothetical protein [Bacillus cereus]MBL3780475.1 hypothetical protein [Bacillus cereus]MBL3791740.1 hypothetical protein [Bacillus cereus]
MITFLTGIIFGLWMKMLIENVVEKKLKKEREQMNFKIDKVTWLSENDKE